MAYAVFTRINLIGGWLTVSRMVQYYQNRRLGCFECARHCPSTVAIVYVACSDCWLYVCGIVRVVLSWLLRESEVKQRSVMGRVTVTERTATPFSKYSLLWHNFTKFGSSGAGSVQGPWMSYEKYYSVKFCQSAWMGAAWHCATISGVFRIS